MDIGLPLKITAIVFWGLIAVGLVLVAEAIHWLHNDMEKTQLEHTKQAALMIQTLARSEGLDSIESLQPQLDMLVTHTAIFRIKMHCGLDSIAAGESGARLALYTNRFPINLPGSEHTDVITYR